MCVIVRDISVFLGEVLRPVNYAGFAVMFLAGLVMTVEKVRNRLRLSRPLLLMTAASVFLAISVTLMKFFYNSEGFWNGFFWFNVGGFSSTLLIALLPGNLKRAASDVKLLNRKVALLFLATTLATLFGDLSYLFAIKSGPVSLVAVVGSTQIAILFVMTLLLSGFFPRVLKERTDRKALITKAVAIALMVAGLLLLR